MKKVFLFLMAASAMVFSSCSDDDGGGSKRPTSVSLVGGGESTVYGFTYDSKGRLSSLTSTYNGAHTTTFAYDSDDNIISASTTGAYTDGYTFAYDGDGKMTMITRTGDAPTPVTWTNDNTMTFDGNTIMFDSKGDLQLFETAAFTRDSGKGAFASVKGANPFVFAFVEQFTLFFASKRPVASITGTGVAYTMNNDLEGGYLSEATFTAASVPYTMTISY